MSNFARMTFRRLLILYFPQESFVSKYDAFIKHLSIKYNITELYKDTIKVINSSKRV